MKKGTYIITIIFFVAVGGLYYLKQSKNTVKKEFDIAAHTVAEFDYIQLCNNTDTIILNKMDEGWLFNGSIQASKLKVTLMLDVLESLTVNNPVTGPTGKSIKDEIEQNGVEVSCFTKGTKVYSLSLISILKNLKGNYGYKKNHQYVVHMSSPGHQGNLQDLFSTDKSYWQSNVLFSFSPEQIMGIEIDWENEQESFSIVNHDSTQSFLVGGVDKTNAADLNKLKFYLYEFRNIDLLDKKDSYRNNKGEYLCTITAKIKKYSISAQMYKMISPEGTDDNAYMVVYIPETNVWGSINYLKMAPIMQKSLFFMKTNL